LQDIKEQLRDLQLKSSDDSSVSGSSSILTIPSQQAIASESTFLGESSFDNHSAQASLTAEVSARDFHFNGTGSQIGASLKLLQSFMGKEGSSTSSSNDLSFPQATSVAPATKLELPPLSLVLAALKRASGMLSLHLCVSDCAENSVS